jgi:CRP-like cAMP-binding protein
MTVPDITTRPAAPPATRNRLLALLPAEDYDLLEPHLERREVPLREVLAGPNTPFTHVFFPDVGVISVVSRLADGNMVEVGTVGNEGVAGLSIVLEGESEPNTTRMQIPGAVTTVPAGVIRRLVGERPALRRLLHRYAHAYMIQLAQTAACNRAHEIAERCARWLLMVHDRMGSDQFPLTQEALAEMLGVRRAGVTVAAGMLQRAALIKYRRGRITILDRPGLESASCECYGIVRAQFDRLLDGPRPAVA